MSNVLRRKTLKAVLISNTNQFGTAIHKIPVDTVGEVVEIYNTANGSKKWELNFAGEKWSITDEAVLLRRVKILK